MGNSDGGGDGLSVVGGVGGVVDVGLLNDLLDGVDLVGGGHGHGAGHLHGVGAGHVLGHQDLALHGDGHVDGYIDVVLVDLELGHNLGLLGRDDGVGAHGGEDPLLDDGVNGSGTSGDGCGRDGGQGGGRDWEDGRGQGAGLNKVLGRAGDVGDSGLGDDILTGLDVLVTGLDLLGTDLDGLVADHAVLDMLLDNGRAGGIGLVGLTDGDRRMRIGAQRGGGEAVAGLGVSLGHRGTVGAGNKGECNLEMWTKISIYAWPGMPRKTNIYESAVFLNCAVMAQC